MSVVPKSEEKSKDAQAEQPASGKELQDDEIKEIVFLPTSKDGDSTEFLKLRLPVSIDKFFELFIADDAVFSSKDRLEMQGNFFKSHLIMLTLLRFVRNRCCSLEAE